MCCHGTGAASEILDFLVDLIKKDPTQSRAPPELVEETIVFALDLAHTGAAAAHACACQPAIQGMAHAGAAAVRVVCTPASQLSMRQATPPIWPSPVRRLLPWVQPLLPRLVHFNMLGSTCCGWQVLARMPCTELMLINMNLWLLCLDVSSEGAYSCACVGARLNHWIFHT